MMFKFLPNSKIFCAWLRKFLTLVGALAVLGATGGLGLRALRNHAPDNLGEIVSPDGHYRILVAEDLVGFPGQACIKDAYVLKVGKSLDRNDEDSHIYAGACDGLTNIHWVGDTIEGTVNISAATDGVARLSLRSFGAGGKVRMKWISNRP
jgi:hypothetical protein